VVVRPAIKNPAAQIALHRAHAKEAKVAPKKAAAAKKPEPENKPEPAEKK
jgi:hypothetical protein